MKAEPCVINFKCLNQNNFQRIGEDQNDEVSFYYDKGSNKTIVIQKDCIKIFNKDVTNMKTVIKYALDRKLINMITVDKNLNYMIIELDKPKSIPMNSSTKLKDNQIIIIDIKEIKVLDILSDNYENLLGFFFIEKDSLIKKDDSNIFNLCFVFIDCVIICEMNKDEINKNQKLKEEFNIDDVKIEKQKRKILKEIKIHKMQSTSLIKDYNYNRKYRILACILMDETVDFYNLSDNKYFNYKIHHSFFLSNVKNNTNVNRKKSKKFFKGFSKPDPVEMLNIRKNFFSQDKYAQSQYFLENIYDNLYFFHLCFEDGKIHIYKIENLSEQGIIEMHSIDTKNNKFGSLQFIDNLIILHNMLLNSIMVIDLKYKKLIIHDCKSVDFNYQNNKMVSGPMFEERNEQMKSLNIYYVSFNSQIYSSNEFNKLQYASKERVSKDTFYIHDLISILLRRCNSRDSVIKLLKRLILSKKNILYVKLIFNEIVHNLKNSSAINLINYYKVDLIQDSTYYDLPKILDCITKKKSTIHQSDIFYSLFKTFEYDYNSDSSEQKFIYNIIFYILYFYRLLCEHPESMKIHSSFYNVLTIYIQKCDLESVLFLFESKYIPDISDIGEYLIGCSNFKRIGNYCELLGLITLTRLKKYDFVLNYLIGKKMTVQAFYYLKKFYCDIQQSERKMFVTLIAQLLKKHHKSLICNRKQYKITKENKERIEKEINMLETLKDGIYSAIKEFEIGYYIKIIIDKKKLDINTADCKYKVPDSITFLMIIDYSFPLNPPKILSKTNICFPNLMDGRNLNNSIITKEWDPENISLYDVALMIPPFIKKILSSEAYCFYGHYDLGAVYDMKNYNNMLVNTFICRVDINFEVNPFYYSNPETDYELVLTDDCFVLFELFENNPEMGKIVFWSTLYSITEIQLDKINKIAKINFYSEDKTSDKQLRLILNNVIFFKDALVKRMKNLKVNVESHNIEQGANREKRLSTRDINNMTIEQIEKKIDEFRKKIAKGEITYYNVNTFCELIGKTIEYDNTNNESKHKHLLVEMQNLLKREDVVEKMNSNQ